LKEDGYKRGLTATADKGYLFLATIDTFMTNKNVPDQIGAVVKLDSNFNIQWVQYIILGTNSIEPTDIVEMEDGSFTVSIIESKRWSDYFTKTWIYKISKKGTLLSKWNIPLQICIYTNGFYMFFLNDSTAIISGNCGEREGYIARIGGLGNPMHPSPRPAPYITLPEPVYTIPNLITPNNDRANDTFEILSNQIPATGVQLKIYNRWGSQVYTSANYQHNWAAEDLPDGVYFYQAEVKDKKYKGWVQVMR
jgi:gliding motility-associated-like protein